MPRRDQPQRRDERHAGLGRYLLGQRSIVSRTDFSGGLAERFGADGLGFFDAVPLVLRQPGHDQRRCRLPRPRMLRECAWPGPARAAAR